MSTTLRNKQLAPTADVLESLYGWLQDASDEIDACEDVHAQRSLRELRYAIMVLADIVDRHITAPDVEARCDA